MRRFQWPVRAAAVGLVAVVVVAPAASQPLDPFLGAESISIQEVASSGVQGRARLGMSDRHEQVTIVTVNLEGLMILAPALAAFTRGPARSVGLHVVAGLAFTLALGLAFVLTSRVFPPGA
jgi:hypothetical protein